MVHLASNGDRAPCFLSLVALEYPGHSFSKPKRPFVHVWAMLAVLAGSLSTQAPAESFVGSLGSPSRITDRSSSMVSSKDNRTKPDFRKPRLRVAISRADNDIGISDDHSGRQVALPEIVGDKIHEVALKTYRERVEWIRKHEDSLWFPRLKEIYGPIFRVDAPYNRHLYIFKLIDEAGLTICYFLLLHDPSSQALSKEPRCIDGRWTDVMNEGEERSSLMKRPYVFFDDLNLDQEPELVIEEQVHNGSTYNAVVYHYFRIGEDLSLNHLLALETRLVDLFSEKESGLIVRSIEKLGSNRIKITVSQVSSTNKATPIGEVLLESRDSSSPFVIKSRTAYVEKYGGVLVTGSEGEEAY